MGRMGSKGEGGGERPWTDLWKEVTMAGRWSAEPGCGYDNLHFMFVS